MTRALITTTIRVPTNLATWVRTGLAPSDLVIVAGDRRTPHDEVRRFLDKLPVHATYLHPDDQNWPISEHLGWNCVQRRNLALLEALALGADTITTVDDDNYPLVADFFERTDSALRGSAPYSLVATDSGWWNAGSVLDPPVTLRGFPISRRGTDSTFVRPVELEHAVRVGVVAHQVLEDPDVDAVERIVNRPTVKRMRVGENVVLAPGTWCPFNSQATTYTRELAPLMFVWPHVGRYDDVWASYLAQRVMQEIGRHVCFGYPTVRQNRNEHDVLTDLEAELLGMRLTDRVTEVLRKVQFWPGSTVQQSLAYCFGALATAQVLPEETVSSFTAWLDSLDAAL